MRTKAAIWLLALVALAAATLAVATVAVAAPPSPGMRGRPISVGKPAHVSWTPRMVTGTVATGDVFSVTVSFTVTKPITNPVFSVIPSRRGVSVDASGVPTGTLAANTPYTIEVKAQVPAGFKGRAINGLIVLKEQHSRRVLSSPLPVRVRVARPEAD